METASIRLAESEMNRISTKINSVQRALLERMQHKMCDGNSTEGARRGFVIIICCAAIMHTDCVVA